MLKNIPGIALVFVASLSMTADADIVNTVIYQQTNRVVVGGADAMYDNGAGGQQTTDGTPISQQFITNGGGPTVSTLDISARGEEGPTGGTPTLKTDTQLMFTTDTSGGGFVETWKSVSASATSAVTISDTISVSGVPSGVTGGRLEFNWALTGGSSISAISPTGSVLSDQVSSFVSLSSNVGTGLISSLFLGNGPPDPATLITPSSSVSDNGSAATGTVTLDVDWVVGTPIGVTFDLFSEVVLQAGTNDASQFTANLISNYFNTALLSGVIVYDQNGNMITAPGISVDGTNYTYNTITAVPEPSAFLFGMLAVAGVFVIRFVRRAIR